MQFKFKNLSDLLLTFNTEAKCREYLEQQIWNGKPKCPHCGYNEKAYKLNDGKTYKCANKECQKKYTVTVKTIAENSNIPLQKWFCAIYLFTAHKKGVSSCQLARDLGLAQKTAWFMLHRIREMMRDKAPELLQGEIETDETFMGGSEVNRHKSARAQRAKRNERKAIEAAGGKFTPISGPNDMTPVLAAVQRGGKLVTRVVDKVTTPQLKLFIRDNVAEGASLYTDERGGYKTLKKWYNHESISHIAGEYKRGAVHTNTVEGFFGQMKRGVYGIYHQVSDKHLSRYCDEFAYRYNERKITDHTRFSLSLSQVKGRLTYKQLVANGNEESEKKS